MAFGALAAIQEAGLRVPDDIAVFGFDGLTEGADVQPPLSTVTQPVADLGREAVRMLLALIEQPDHAPVQRFLPTRLTLRRSCGCALTAGAQPPKEVSARPLEPPPLHRLRARHGQNVRHACRALHGEC